MKGKKYVFLGLALILPVLIFIFLKIFGRNEFNVPVWHVDGAIDAGENCDYTYTTPYHIPDSVSVALHIDSDDSLYVISFDPVADNQLKRVPVELKGDRIRIITPAELSLLKMDMATLKNCVLLMETPNSIVLLDKQKRIRGYYDGTDLDEIDRLIVELKIILKRY